MSATRKTVLLGAATAVAVILGAAAATTFIDGDSPAAPPPDAYQPDGTRLGPVSGTEETPLPDTPLLAFHEEREVSLAEYEGQPLVVNFWATWCPPCVAEMPDFQTVADDLADDVAFVGVNARDNHEQAERFVARLTYLSAKLFAFFWKGSSVVKSELSAASYQATHPYADQMSGNAVAAASRIKTASVRRVARTVWTRLRFRLCTLGLGACRLDFVGRGRVGPSPAVPPSSA
jgi:thiol-disulfide isomerase/thioredoxin